jgi:serine protease Do
MKLALPTLAAVAYALGCESRPPATATAQAAQATSPVANQTIDGSRRTAITEAVAKVSPAVVTVQTEVVERVSADLFDQFFGGRSGQRVNAGMGTGFITRNDGVIVTNAHVVQNATRVSVMMRDGTVFPAKVLGVDDMNDLAVLKIEGRSFPVAPIGRSDNLVIGEWAIAIGNPFGFVLGNSEPSVTAGVISATGRNLVGGTEGGGAYLNMIQTDASINQGNSGGPLVNAVGEVIGVNTVIYSPSGGSVGLGFAIPINRAARIAEDLTERGRVRRPWIGVKPRMSGGAAGRAEVSGGAVVETVVPGSPAAKAGLRAGETIVRSRGRDIRNAFDWEAELLDVRVGESIPLVIRSGARDRNVSVEVADLPEVSAEKVAVLRELELVNLTPAIRAERGVRSNRGAVVFRVSDRIRQEIGLQQGDVILQINRFEVNGASDVKRAFDYYQGRAGMRMLFERGGQTYYTDFVIE